MRAAALLVAVSLPAHAGAYLGHDYAAAKFAGGTAVTNATEARIWLDGFQESAQTQQHRGGGGLFAGYRATAWAVEIASTDLGTHTNKVHSRITDAPFFGGPVVTGTFDETVRTHVSAVSLAVLYHDPRGFYGKAGVARWRARQATYERSELVGRQPTVVTNGDGVFGSGWGYTPVWGVGYQTDGRLFGRLFYEQYAKAGGASGVTDGAEVTSGPVRRYGLAVGVNF